VAARRGAPLLRVEDWLLRSVLPGRSGSPPLGLALDRRGVHFDPATPSDLEHLLADAPLDDTGLLDRARSGIAALRLYDLSKYNAHDPDAPVPEPGYVLVIDQTRGDAAVVHGGGAQSVFDEMLAVAQIENPGAPILIKTHPETALGHRPGHYGAGHEDARTRLHADPVSPWKLMEGAVAVYTVSSGLGFEATLAGHRPRVFGQPFYGGWGLTQDENPVPRRSRRLTRAQLFAAAMILYPAWYDPFRDRLCTFEEALAILAAEARAWREDRAGYVASGMRLWKRGAVQKFYGGGGGVRFRDDPARASALAERLERPLLVWAGKATDQHRAAHRYEVEDGFLRSRGLGADLVPPLSLARDGSGIYYDPTRPSDLEALIAASPSLPEGELRRAEQLASTLVAQRLSKYNIATGAPPDLPRGHRILVPGQVEDDASIRLGCDAVATNRALLHATRAANPDAVIVYKPHPDVEAGLRPGALEDAELARLADAVASRTDPATLIALCDEVWTMTSLLGFEALLRGKPVTCLGAPFYAGWGLTRDRGRIPARRQARPPLAGLIHATLIGYPRYRDPVTGRPCPAEVVAHRLSHGPLPRPGRPLRLLAKAQGLLASRADLWR
jgi:capsular polysaccharide export protein